MFTIFFDADVLKVKMSEIVSLTAEGRGIYPGPWRRSPCVMATPPSQETLWIGQLLYKKRHQTIKY